MAGRIGVVAAVLLGTLCTTGAAGAQTPEADLQYRHGLDLRQGRQDEEALRVFREVWTATHAPRAQAQMAFAEQALGLWLAAAGDLDAALAHPDDPWIAGHRALLEASRAIIAQRVGTLEVRGEVVGAEVFLEGRRVGALPLPGPLRVEIGRVSLEVRAPGFLPYARTVQIAPGMPNRETVALAREPPAVLLAPRPPPGRDREPEARRGVAQRALGWAAVAGAAVAVTVGIVALVQQRDQGNEFNASACRLIPEGTLAGPCGELETAANRNAALSIAGYVGGVALGVAAVGLLATAPSSRRGRAAGAGCGPGPGTVGATCGLEF